MVPEAPTPFTKTFYVYHLIQYDSDKATRFACLTHLKVMKLRFCEEPPEHISKR